jgi:alkanesulfonate monooxygenase SsuD/methylene tetrahydromethanopterin reductase-like flavin-dependent oxidoreductase (luciferase family)
MPTDTDPSARLHLAVALDGAGWHPAAWRAPDARAHELFTARYWLDLAREAERGLLDFLTIEDSFSVQSARPFVPDDRTDQVRGRLDAVLIASFLAPLTEHIGLVPTVITTHNEPFHTASAIATLDHASHGRAGWRAQVSARPDDAALFGRAGGSPPGGDREALVDDVFADANDVVAVVRQLWDSWEDDAIIKDVASGRFVDRDRLHYVDFVGQSFSVKGPSIVPRPPQGQPLVVALAHSTVPYQFAARGADIAFVTPHDADQAAAIVAEVRDAEGRVERTGEALRIFGEIVVFLDDDGGAAEARRAQLDELNGKPYRSDALIFAGTADQLADLLLAWSERGLDGYRLRPATVPHDLQAITRDLVPVLQRRGRFRLAHDDETLRGRLGLPRPPSRYARRAHSSASAR